MVISQFNAASFSVPSSASRMLTALQPSNLHSCLVTKWVTTWIYYTQFGSLHSFCPIPDEHIWNYLCQGIASGLSSRSLTMQVPDPSSVEQISPVFISSLKWLYEIVNTVHFQTSTTRYNRKLYYLLSFKLRFDYDRWRFGPYCL